MTTLDHTLAGAFVTGAMTNAGASIAPPNGDTDPTASPLQDQIFDVPGLGLIRVRANLITPPSEEDPPAA